MRKQAKEFKEQDEKQNTTQDAISQLLSSESKNTNC